MGSADQLIVESEAGSVLRTASPALAQVFAEAPHPPSWGPTSRPRAASLLQDHLRAERSPLREKKFILAVHVSLTSFCSARCVQPEKQEEVYFRERRDPNPDFWQPTSKLFE